MRALPLLALPLLLAACGADGSGGPTVRDPADAAGAYTGIGANETLRFTGTEPFWGGEAKGSMLTYTTPENIDGATISVERFAGNNGVSFSGTLEGRRFDMTVSEALCSDGMSDRTYPFTVTLQIGKDSRSGCGWTDRRSFAGPEQP